MNPDSLLTPTLSSFWGGEGDGVAVVIAVQWFNARKSFRENITPALSRLRGVEGEDIARSAF